MTQGFLEIKIGESKQLFLTPFGAHLIDQDPAWMIRRSTKGVCELLGRRRKKYTPAAQDDEHEKVEISGCLTMRRPSLATLMEVLQSCDL